MMNIYEEYHLDTYPIVQHPLVKRVLQLLIDADHIFLTGMLVGHLIRTPGIETEFSRIYTEQHNTLTIDGYQFVILYHPNDELICTVTLDHQILVKCTECLDTGNNPDPVIRRVNKRV